MKNDCITRSCITTIYLPATEVKGARIKAVAPVGHYLTIPYPYELSGEPAHAEAARKLAEKLGWGGEWFVASSATNQRGYVFVRPLPESLAFSV